MRANDFLNLREETEREIRRLERELEVARESVTIPPIEKLRAAEPKDIQAGAVIYHANGDDGWFWNIVEEVQNPASDFKAYVADDGCRYGLNGAYVDAAGDAGDGAREAITS